MSGRGMKSLKIYICFHFKWEKAKLGNTDRKKMVKEK